MHIKFILSLLGREKLQASVFPPGLWNLYVQFSVSVALLCFVLHHHLSPSVRDELVAVATTQFPASSDWALAMSQSTAVIAYLARTLAGSPDPHPYIDWRLGEFSQSSSWLATHTQDDACCFYEVRHGAPLKIAVSLACAVCVVFKTFIYIVLNYAFVFDVCVYAVGVVYWRTAWPATYARVP
jgi:hypothetical protein